MSNEHDMSRQPGEMMFLAKCTRSACTAGKVRQCHKGVTTHLAYQSSYAIAIYANENVSRQIELDSKRNNLKRKEQS